MEMWIAIERPKNRVNRLERTRCKDQSVLDFGEVYFSRWRNPWSRITLVYKLMNDFSSDEDSDPEQVRGIKEMQKNLALLQSSLGIRTLTVAGDWETAWKLQCFNCKGFGHYAKECKKPKRVKDYSYHKEKMMMCKQAEQGVPLQAEQADWLADTDEEIDEQELEAHYSFMAKIQEVLPEESKCDDERAALANLIANLTLDTEENKTILKQLKKANASLTQELDECKTNLDKTSRALKEATSCRDICKLKEKSKVISDLKVKEEKDIDKMIEMDKQLKFLNEIVYTRNQSIQTIHMLAPKCSTYNGRPTFANPRYLKKAQSEKPCLYEIPYDTSDLANRFAPNREETMTLENKSRSKLNKDKVKPYDYTNQNSLYEIFKGPSLEYLYQLERAKEVRKTMWRKPFVRTKQNLLSQPVFKILVKVDKDTEAHHGYHTHQYLRRFNMGAQDRGTPLHPARACLPDSPTHQSPGYIPESDPEEDLEEDDEEDPEEDPADYPADRGDDDDEHIAPADPAAVAYSADQDPYIAYRATARMSIRTQAPTPFLSEEVAERVLALPTPPPSPLSPYSSPLPQIPSPPLPIPPPISPAYVDRSLGSRAAGVRQRDALPSHVHKTEMPEMCLPLRKRLCRTTPGPGYEVGESSAAGTARQVGPTTARADLYGFADTLEAAPGRRMSRELGYGIRDTWDDLVGAIQEIAPTTLEGVNQRVIELSTTIDQEDEIIYSQLDDARYDRALLRARVNMLDGDRPFHRRTAILMEEEARLSRAAWAQSMDACDQVHSEGILLRTTVMAQQSEIAELQAADRRRQSVISELLKADYRRQRQLVEALKIVKSLKTQMIELQTQQGPAKDPAEPELPEEASSSS
ncbi:reverse transcriptase domain-containing protein [Tanacetum coccineum]